MSKHSTQFQGFYVPNSTQVPDTLFDELLPELSGAELKVVLYIIRRTFGFKRQSDTISINQMLRGITKKNGEVLDRGTGLSKPTLLHAIKRLTQRAIILPERQYDEKGGYIWTRLSGPWTVSALGGGDPKEAWLMSGRSVRPGGVNRAPTSAGAISARFRPWKPEIFSISPTVGAGVPPAEPWKGTWETVTVIGFASTGTFKTGLCGQVSFDELCIDTAFLPCCFDIVSHLDGIVTLTVAGERERVG